MSNDANSGEYTDVNLEPGAFLWVDATYKVFMTKLGDLHLCKYSAYEIYADFVKADPKTGDCPEEYQRCSPYTASNNTLCIKESEDKN